MQRCSNHGNNGGKPIERENYLNTNYGWKSWLLTTDHKRIAILYLISITFMFFIGGFFATMIRMELLTPAGDLMTSDTYNKMFTMHGIVMVFFFLIPSIPATLGNFLIPMMIGAKDLAFPRINLLSWYIYIVGGADTILRDPQRRSGHRLDVLYAVQHARIRIRTYRRRHRHLHHWILVHPDRTELHRDHPPHARAGHDLVSAAAVRLGHYATSVISWARR